ncbi:DUF1501 domain-containing protein [Roseimaritima ulvae]|uniref:DUF1501 domain-containing protein n=1 Tax=Roseimaritima ulvae TaxID=980254 RepID=A0A5B9QXA8_9BACT|nr:DUF1501 domain-containing protein [Roseimaritima ulvae]QEG43648.1 hypothetical protein UC8_57000 [Roseimaritima ulvae]
MTNWMQPSRRQFLRSTLGGVTALGVGTAIPHCFAQAAQPDDATADDRILVVVQLSGGNDGLNTLVPYADDDYRAARAKLAVPTSDVLKCDDDFGFHPAMRGLYDLLQAGQLTAIQGVGYDQPNRSHFESMDIWHTCRRKTEQRPDGWIGRLLEQPSMDTGGDVPALHLGHEQQPFAVVSQQVRVPTVKQLAEFQLRGTDRKSLRSLLTQSLPAETTDSDGLLGFLQSSTSAALTASQRVAEASSDYQSEVQYPESQLGNKLRVVAQLIDAGLKTRVYYVQLDGFDTHAEQADTHAILLRQWSEAVSALVQDLDAHDHGQRVCVMTFSEFGRRVSENASGGTDHGAAGPMFLCGGGLQAGLVGTRPDLSDLHDGDLKHHIDFRQVYRTVLESWLGVDPAPILGGDYESLPLFV